MPSINSSTLQHLSQDHQIGEFQDFDKENINPGKLVSLLRKMFDEGTYELHMVHDVLSVRAPRPLSTAEVNCCK
ncbi:hypothetical protein FOPG_16210 [Fusarium oxysporum f. sp. conglutinans race 2 54008]|uniref:Uncharacterized protein n=3 Tax=Fusarium oxysporum TaxID=5507 RepID=W9I4I4_FUSOX|nr:hypothetical protein FOYG_07441 [Fusarium oxysporum NRRL 32931]EXL67677.1 hypothetical protein FOPG_16210 [Fusarium oxysporum f. sp. conglutinans race 2 54008]WKT45340.1 hypothetical protein QSH57_010193 [Fusarium oxysporum f. sp. vasinfectum]SCO78412.1 uncharacterized protein FRV6_02625 [Fusarium oxysporum]